MRPMGGHGYERKYLSTTTTQWTDRQTDTEINKRKNERMETRIQYINEKKKNLRQRIGNEWKIGVGGWSGVVLKGVLWNGTGPGRYGSYAMEVCTLY